MAKKKSRNVRSVPTELRKQRLERLSAALEGKREGQPDVPAIKPYALGMLMHPDDKDKGKAEGGTIRGILRGDRPLTHAKAVQLHRHLAGITVEHLIVRLLPWEQAEFERKAPPRKKKPAPKTAQAVPKVETVAEEDADTVDTRAPGALPPQCNAGCVTITIPDLGGRSCPATVRVLKDPLRLVITAVTPIAEDDAPAMLIAVRSLLSAPRQDT